MEDDAAKIEAIWNRPGKKGRTRKPDIDGITDKVRRQLEYVLAPGVYGWTRDLSDGSLEIPSLRAETEGNGDIGRYLDGLPTDRKIVVPLVTNPRLAGMLERRGFVLRERFFPEILGGTWSNAWVRKPTPAAQRRCTCEVHPAWWGSPVNPDCPVHGL